MDKKLTKLFLVKEYTKNKKTIRQIAKKVVCSHTTIYKYIRLFKIKTRPSGIEKINISKSILEKEYLRNKKSSIQIAKLFNCSHTAILQYLKNYKTKTRTISQAKKEFFKNPKNHPNYKNGNSLIQHYCIDCKKEISKQAKRCGSCRTKNRYRNIKNHPTYIDGRSYTNYPREFNKILKEQIRKRDNFECQICNMTEEEHIIIYGREIEVHHIDYNKQNCGKDNLITLCKQCNIRVNFNRKTWKEALRRKLCQNV